MTALRQIAAFLRESWRRSSGPVGTVDLLGGTLIAALGVAMHVDLAPLALAVVIGALLIRLLILSPAKMWAGRDDPDDSPKVVVQPGGTYIDKYYAAPPSSTAGVSPEPDPATATGTALDAEVRISPAIPRSRRKSKHDPQDPPPSLGL